MLPLKNLVLLLFIVTLTGCAAPMTQRVEVSDAATKAEAEHQLEIAVKDSVSDQQRLSHIYWHISTQAHALCGDNVGPHIGAFVITKPKNAMGPAFERLYGIRDLQTVLFVAKNGPAEKAGLKARDLLLKINGIDTEDRSAISELREKLPPEAPIHVEISRDGQRLSLTINPVKGCRYPAIVVQQQIVNAFADGKSIMIARGMMSFAKDDNELALVVSHELAHNAMRHMDAKKQNMGLGFLADLAVVLLSRGQISNTNFAQIAANAYSQEFEAEADYVGLYLMANSGLPIDNAPQFWRRMASAHPANIRTNHSASHPSTAYRMVALEETVKEIKTKIATGAPLVPNMKDGKPTVSTKPEAKPASEGSK